VQSSVTYTLAANLENLTLTGTAAIDGTGNALDNVLTGNTAANTLTGGAGNDTYVVDNAGDVVVEAIGEGTDLVRSSVTYALGANTENLTLTGTATSTALATAWPTRSPATVAPTRWTAAAVPTR
jgi:Ca2+-binding RTX toxin-like protein